METFHLENIVSPFAWPIGIHRQRSGGVRPDELGTLLSQTLGRC